MHKVLLTRQEAARLVGGLGVLSELVNLAHEHREDDPDLVDFGDGVVLAVEPSVKLGDYHLRGPDQEAVRRLLR